MLNFVFSINFVLAKQQRQGTSHFYIVYNVSQVISACLYHHLPVILRHCIYNYSTTVASERLRGNSIVSDL